VIGLDDDQTLLAIGANSRFMMVSRKHRLVVTAFFSNEATVKCAGEQ
jgi:hypothetical protein